MIHSTAGGTMREYHRYDYAKVEIDGTMHFYLSPFKELKEGDIVTVDSPNGTYEIEITEIK